jgi:GntR family transcriptional regulator
VHAYEQIAEQLAAEINAGEWPTGSLLPTIPELEKRFGVSRITVRGGLRELEKQGLVYTGYADGRRGTIVRSTGLTDYLLSDPLRYKGEPPKAGTFAQFAARLGRTPSTRFEMRLQLVEPWIAKRLGVDPEELVVVRIIHQLLDNEPWSRETSYYARDLAAVVGMDAPHTLDQGTMRTLADAGYREIAHVDEITYEAASPQDAYDLSVEVGAPLFVQTRTAATAERVTRVSRFMWMARNSRMVFEAGEEAGLEVIRAARADDVESVLR